MKILVCGSREWNDPVPVKKAVNWVLEQYGPEVEVIHGDARGADRLFAAKFTALRAEWFHEATTEASVTAFPADWDTNGKRAGYLRNAQMLEQRPDLVIAFRLTLDDEGTKLLESKGTDMMIDMAKKAGVNGIIVKGPKVVEAKPEPVAQGVWVDDNLPF